MTMIVRRCYGILVENHLPRSVAVMIRRRSGPIVLIAVPPLDLASWPFGTHVDEIAVHGDDALDHDAPPGVVVTFKWRD
jgi:hypothetical protein